MDLHYVKFNKFKRLEKATLLTQSKLVALIGANEVGKSSILQALSYLNNDQKISPTHISEGLQADEDEVIIEAAFLLGSLDHKLITECDPENTSKWFFVRKLRNGERKYELKPTLIHKKYYREQVIEKIDTFLGSNKSENVNLHFDNDFIDRIKKLKSSLKKSLTKDDKIQATEGIILPQPSTVPQRLNDEIKNEAKFIEERLSLYLKKENFNDIVEIKSIIKTLLNAIHKLSSHENTLLNRASIEKLKTKIPVFILFSEDHRNLPKNYNLNLDNQKDSSKGKPNLALNNLLQVAQLSIDDLTENWRNRSKIKTLLNQGNKRIKEFYCGKWSQADGIYPVLDNDNSMLTISIENQEYINFDIDQRSDGLRQFIALINFLEAEHLSQSPILLIDEVEIHLHYDAQIDLMKILESQKVASKVIYTTHSIGCLPEDLGIGIQMIQPSSEHIERSDIIPKFWTKWKNCEFGLTPILFGLGATQMAHIALRPALFAEGMSEMIALPTIFKQVTKKDNLGFQILGGLSETNQYALLNNQAPKVIYLTDCDKAGEQYRKKLEEQNISSDLIKQLPGDHHALVLEDFIVLDLYVRAVNEEIQQWNQNPEILKHNDFEGADRPRQLQNWCRLKSLKFPVKINIIYRIVDYAYGDEKAQIIDTKYTQKFKELYESILQGLEI